MDYHRLSSYESRRIRARVECVTTEWSGDAQTSSATRQRREPYWLPRLKGYPARIAHVLPLALKFESRATFTSRQDGNQLLVLVHLHFVSTASSTRLSTSGPSPRFNTTMSCRFLALPAELRQRVYIFVFQGPAAIRIYTSEQQRRYSPRSRPKDEQLLRFRANYDILLTNKTTFNEALVLYYDLTTVRLSFCELVHMPMTFQQLSHVRKIQLEVCCDEHDEWLANDGSGLEDILPRLQQFSRLETLRLPCLIEIDEDEHADCFGEQPTGSHLRDGFTSDEVYGELVEAITVALRHTKVYVKAIGIIAIADGHGGYQKSTIVSAIDFNGEHSVRD